MDIDAEVEIQYSFQHPILVLIHERSCFPSFQEWKDSILTFIPLLSSHTNFVIQIRNKLPLANSEFYMLSKVLPLHPRILVNVPSLSKTHLRRHRTEKEIEIVDGVSASVHSLDLALRFQNHYRFFQFGPIYQPISKTGIAVGLSKILPFIRNNIKVVVVGGITLSNIDEVLEQNIFGVGIIGSILLSENPYDKAIAFLEILQAHSRNLSQTILSE
jgi:hypothetical protein